MSDYTPRRETSFIAVHCSDTPASMDIGEAEIRQWHLDRKWDDIGYNVVIRRSGLVEMGRHPDAQGAHVAGFNSRAMGVCLVGGGKGENNFTDRQFASLLTTLRFLRLYAPGAHIQGHRDFPNVAKDCPSFDVREWLQETDPTLL